MGAQTLGDFPDHRLAHAESEREVLARREFCPDRVNTVANIARQLLRDLMRQGKGLGQQDSLFLDLSGLHVI
jgi:hypothetical protein